jgi:hypothetical protein
MAKGFGKANLDNTYEGFKYFKLRTPDQRKGEESTELVLRLLPAMHSYEDTSDWKFYYGQHYGYFGNNPRNPEKPRSRPFGCIQKKNKNKEIVISCPKCVEIEGVRALQKKREQEVEAAHPSAGDKELREIKRADDKLAALGKWLSNHNCDKKFWINCMNMQNEFGVLQLSYKTTQEILIPLLKKLRDEEKIDAFDATAGVWLKFTRTGVRPSVTDRIEVFTETVDIGQGRKAKINKVAPLTDELIEKALKICPDLKTSVVKFIPVETIQALVDCSGDPDEVDRIWPQEAAKTATPAAAATTTVIETKTVVKEPVGLSATVDDDEDGPVDDEEVTSAPAQAASTALTEEEQLEAQLAAIRAKKATQAAPAASAAPAGDPAVDDFLSKFSA